MAKTTPASSAEPQPIEALQKRYERLNTKKIQVDTNLENAKGQLASLKDELRKSYGTDDVAALREKVAAMTAENETKRRDYQAQLDQIDAKLAEIEQRVAATENGQASGADAK